MSTDIQVLVKLRDESMKALFATHHTKEGSNPTISDPIAVPSYLAPVSKGYQGYQGCQG